MTLHLVPHYCYNPSAWKLSYRIRSKCVHYILDLAKSRHFRSISQAKTYTKTFYLIVQSAVATSCGLYSDTKENSRDKACLRTGRRWNHWSCPQVKENTSRGPRTRSRQGNCQNIQSQGGSVMKIFYWWETRNSTLKSVISKLSDTFLPRMLHFKIYGSHLRMQRVLVHWHVCNLWAYTSLYNIVWDYLANTVFQLV